MKKVMLVFGTRPEAIKMCPLVLELKKRQTLDVKVCVTAQHRQMLDQVLSTFGVVPDYDLNIMKDRQSLFDITTNVLNGIKGVLEEAKPDVVLVHGDTSTTFVTALACFYLQIPVGHVEAGLRTYNIYSPYPEEFNREAVSIVSQYNFAPTPLSRDNLIREGRKAENIYVTGNTVIDAMQHTVKSDYHHPELDWVGSDKLIFITAHRRENLGEPMHHMFRAIRRVLDEHDDLKAVYPIHMNPVVREAAEAELGGCEKIHIIEPIEVFDCHNFEARSYLCLTDSGGIQEECPSYGVPVLVMRDTTERPEGVDAGTLKLVGTDEKTIYNTFKMLLENKAEYERTINISSNGQTSEDIDFITDKMLQCACYDGVSGDDVDDYYSGKKLDDYVLLGKTLISHPGTIIQQEQEQVYFVFDELRDYCLARAIIRKNITEKYEPDKVIEFLKEANQKNLSCEEGIAQFAYAFFKTDEEVSRRDQTEKYCKEILVLYRDDKDPYNFINSREEFRCIGLRIIFAMNEKLAPFEFDYIREILNKEGERFDTGLLFDTAVRGTMNGNPFNIDEYVDMVIGLNSWDKIGNALMDASSFDYLHEKEYPHALFTLFKKEEDETKKRQLQKALELFALCIRYSNAKEQSQFEKQCIALPNHNEIKEALMKKIEEACVQ